MRMLLMCLPACNRNERYSAVIHSSLTQSEHVFRRGLTRVLNHDRDLQAPGRDFCRNLCFSTRRTFFMPLSSSGGFVSANGRLALVAGHPGHELKVFGWMSQHSPRVYLLTDGSGRHGISRTAASRSVIADLQAQPGEVFGDISDAQIYEAMLHKDLPLFFSVVDELANSFVRHQIDLVVGDAAEGFNPTHDLCRLLINASVLIAERTSGRRIANFEFCLTEWEQNCPPPKHDHR